MNGQILLVDDEPVLREVLGTLLRRNGYGVIEAGTAADAVAAVADGEIELMLLDLMLPDGNGLDVLRQVKTLAPEVVVVIITAYSSIEGAIEAMREGAFHYIPKPFKNQEVLLTVRRGLEQRSLRAENQLLKTELDSLYGLGNLIGRSEPMRKVFEIIRLVAPSKSHVLIEGEGGTGKELVARTIHHHSRRARKPFVVVTTDGIAPEVLAESLFGPDGAKAPPGLLENANGGSVFVDELAELPRSLQKSLHDVLRTERHPRTGRRIDVRLLAASARDLGRLVAEGGLEEGLHRELQGVSISLPPLRKRREDIPLLLRYFVERASADDGREPPTISTDAVRVLLEASWPGNVRELEAAVRHAVSIANGSEGLLPRHFGQRANGDRRSTGPIAVPQPPLPSQGTTFKDAVREYERQMILRALTLTGGVQKRAAELLHIKPTTLNEMIKRLGLQEESVEGAAEIGQRA